MLKLILVIFSTAIFVFVSSKFTIEGSKAFYFTRTNNKSKNLTFEQTSENGQGHGTTWALKRFDIHLMYIAEGQYYWVQIKSDEWKNKMAISKMARVVNQTGDTLIFNDDASLYKLNISTGSIEAEPYKTIWDIENICFTKSKENASTFDFIIESNNTLREYNGTTTLLSSSSSVLNQAIWFRDSDEQSEVTQTALFEVEFTESEFNSTETFCKGVSSSEIGTSVEVDGIIMPFR